MKLLQSLFASSNPQRLYDNALACITDGNYAKASRLLEKALPLAPTSAAIHFTAAFCFMELAKGKTGASEPALTAQLEKPATYCRRAVELSDEGGGLTNDQIAKACLLVGTYYRHARDYDAAIRFLERALSICQETLPPRMELSATYYLRGDHKKALVLARECLTAEPASEGTRRHWSALCEELGIEPYSTLPEEEKRRIYRDFKMQSEMEWLGGLARAVDAIGRGPKVDFKELREAGFTRIASHYGINRFDIILIFMEGDMKKWPLTGVVG